MKIVAFLEAHIEKIVLAIVALVFMWLLMTRVLLSPNQVEYANRTYAPSEIDLQIQKEAEALRAELADTSAVAQREYDERFSKFRELFDSPLASLNLTAGLMLPAETSEDVVVKGVYPVPQIPPVKDVKAGYIRAAAYVPLSEVTEQNTYDKVKHRVGDIDIVTVEGQFDTKSLYEQFLESFAGFGLPPEWRDPCLAKPVFGAVELQRQELLPDGTWSDWQVVPRSRVEDRGRMFEIAQDVSQLPPGGIEVRLLQFSDWQVIRDLLQPPTYSIASPDEQWWPPSLYSEYAKQRDERLRDEREKARQQKQDEAERKRAERLGGGVGGGLYGTIGAGTGYGGRTGLRGTTTGARRGVAGRGTLARGTPRTGVRGRTGVGGARTSTARTGAAGRLGGLLGGLAPPGAAGQKTTQVDLNAKLNELLINQNTDFSKLDKPLTFWVIDDTVEPGKKYRYRVRLGVFNPLAGTNKFKDADESLKNSVYLWSGFSELTDVVSIPKMLYAFPTEIQTDPLAVTVNVCRYLMGYWYVKKFTVRRGEEIGKVVENDQAKPKQDTATPASPYSGFFGGSVSTSLQDNRKLPQTVDYTTGAVMIDAELVHDWASASAARPRQYYQMLHSYDEGLTIERMPIGSPYWDRELASTYAKIRELAQREKKELLAFSAGRGRRGGGLYRPGTGVPGSGRGGILQMLQGMRGRGRQ